MTRQYLSAREAAEALGVSAATLYSYVSRGLVRSEQTGGGRARRYHAEDILRLQERRERRRDPARAVESALYWGDPILESAITLISDGRYYYRGRDALELAATRSVEQVAALIWTGDEAAHSELFGASWTPPHWLPTHADSCAHLPPIDVFLSALPRARADDPAAYDLRPAAVAQTGVRILRLLTALAAGARPGGVAETLQAGWAPGDKRTAAALGSALILCADHELNAATLAARCTASAGATPYEVVSAGLAATQGVEHGGRTRRVEAFLREVGSPRGARAAITGRLERGESLPGFGHPLYPEGDPRARALLELAASARPNSPPVQLATAVVHEAAALIGEHPAVDLGVAALAGALGLPPGGALALFALGRTIGWIGHAMEQYAAERMIRPRARYVGEQPRGD